MKTIYSLISIVNIFIFSSTLFSQENETVNCEASYQHFCFSEHEGYGGASVRLSEFNGKHLLTYGFSGAYILSRHFALGAGGYSSFYSFKFSDPENPITDGHDIQFGYGGLMPELFFYR